MCNSTMLQAVSEKSVAMLMDNNDDNDTYMHDGAFAGPIILAYR